EAEMWAALVSPEETQRRKKVQASLLEDAREHPKEYSEVRSPAHSIWALKSFEMQCPWVDRADTAVVARMKATFEARRQWEAKSIRALPSGDEAPPGRRVSRDAWGVPHRAGQDRAGDDHLPAPFLIDERGRPANENLRSALEKHAVRDR